MRLAMSEGETASPNVDRTQISINNGFYNLNLINDAPLHLLLDRPKRIGGYLIR